MRHHVMFVATALVGAVATIACGGKLDGEDGDASLSNQDGHAADTASADAPYSGQCCDIYDGSTAEPCDHDANDYGFGGQPADNEAGVYFCGYNKFSDLWLHCAYTTGHRWACCAPEDPSCCPKIAEPDEAGNPPAKPGACNGTDPADGY